MGSADKVDIIALGKFRDNVLAKGERHSAVILTPLVDFFVGVRPEEITEEAGVGDVGRTDYVLDSVDFN